MIRFQDSRPDHWAHADRPREDAAGGSLYWPAQYFAMLCMAAVLLFLAVAAASAHDFYPIECCSGYDCAPVDKAEMTSPTYVAPAEANALAPGEPTVFGMPVLIVTTRHGSAPVPEGMPRRLSPDGRMHACIVRGKVLCLWVPPGS